MCLVKQHACLLYRVSSCPHSILIKEAQKLMQRRICITSLLARLKRQDERQFNATKHLVFMFDHSRQRVFDICCDNTLLIQLKSFSTNFLYYTSDQV